MRVRLVGLFVVALVAGCGRDQVAGARSASVRRGGPGLATPPGLTVLTATSTPGAHRGRAGRSVMCSTSSAGEACSYGDGAAAQDPEFVESHLIVKFRDRLREPADVIRSHGLRFADNCPSGGRDLDALDYRYHVAAVVPVFRPLFGTATAVPGRGALAERRRLLAESISRSRAAFRARQKRAPRGAGVPDLTNVYFFEVPAGTDVRRMALDYSSNENVEYAVPDDLARLDFLPNDPYLSSSGAWGQDYSDLWGIEKIGAPAAWDTAAGLGVVVAVVDSGLDYDHADVASNVWANDVEVAGSPGVDDDANGYVDDVRGWDFAYGDADVMDHYGHGTHVAGIVAATGNNAIGVVGVAYRAKIMPVKGFDDSGHGTFATLANGIAYAALNGADVISNSWGCYATTGCASSVLDDALALARSLGCVVTFAAGNDSGDVRYQSPANRQDVITVASSGEDDSISWFSNFGHFIDVAAPGGGPGAGSEHANILSLRAAGTGNPTYVVGTDYLRMSGTSMATPHVSGVAALLLSANPELTVAQVESIIKHTAADQVGDPALDVPGFDVHYGWGRLDAAAAVARAFDPPADPPILDVDADLEFGLPQSTCGGPWSLSLDAFNIGGGTLSWSASAPSWLTVAPSSGSTPSLGVLASIDTLSSRSGTLTIDPLDASVAPARIPVSEQVRSSVTIVNCDAAISRTTGDQQWGPIFSNFNDSPPGIPDGSGGAIYAWNDWRVGGRPQVFAQRVDSLGNPLWTVNGLGLSSPLDYSQAPAIVSDANGGAIVAWIEGSAAGSSDAHVRVQRVNSAGAKLWGADGVTVSQGTEGDAEPNLVADGAGGTVVAWVRYSNGYDQSDVYAQRLDSNGAPLWQTGGTPVTLAAGTQANVVMAADGNGGAIVAWEDARASTTWSIYAQHVGPAGNALWTQDGIAVTPTKVHGPSIVSDGAGGAIIAWHDFRSVDVPSWAFGDIYAARVDATGAALWGTGGSPVVVGVSASSSPYMPSNGPSAVRMARDGKGGLFVTWIDDRSGRGLDIYGQRLDSGGNRLWGDSGMPVTTAGGDQVSPAVIWDGDDGAIYVFSDSRPGNADIFLQRLGPTGNRLLGASGLWIERKSGGLGLPNPGFTYPGDQFFPYLVPLANHRVLVTWDDHTSGDTGVDFVGKVVEFASNVAISPDGATVASNGTVSFTASGGSGEGFTWSLATNASGGSIGSTSGAYAAGPTGGVTDVVQVKDSFGNVDTVDVLVVAPVSVDPASATVAPGGHVGFAASGGSGGGYTWTLATNASGGTIDPATGAYAAGPTGGATDVVQATDSLGNTGVANVDVTAAPAEESGCGCGSAAGGSAPLLFAAALLAFGRRARTGGERSRRAFAPPEGRGRARRARRAHPRDRT